MKKRNIPFGYQYQNGVITTHPQEVAVLNRIFSEYQNGLSLLEITNRLNAEKIEYQPGVTGWNKSRIMRLIEDERYTGIDNFPAIIDKGTHQVMVEMKAQKNTQHGTDRTCEIFHIDVPVTCPECGGEMVRRHDSRFKKCQQRWICSNVDCLSKKVKRNDGQARPKYYVENNHPAIIDPATFGRAQEELARRTGKRKVKQKGTKTEQGRYSSKYALTELLVCGECGTPYRRCTWTVKGEKKPVWRCINRLDFGKKYCHHSPTMEESVLQEAVMAAIMRTAKQGADVLGTLKLHIGMGLKNDSSEDNSLDIQIRIAEIDAKFKAMLQAIATDTVEEFDEHQATALMAEKNSLEQQLAQLDNAQQEKENAESRLDEIFTILDGLENHPMMYDDRLVRQVLECVVVESKDKLKVIFAGGLEVEQTIPV